MQKSRIAMVIKANEMLTRANTIAKYSIIANTSVFVAYAGMHLSFKTP